MYIHLFHIYIYGLYGLYIYVYMNYRCTTYKPGCEIGVMLTVHQLSYLGV